MLDGIGQLEDGKGIGGRREPRYLLVHTQNTAHYHSRMLEML